MSRNKREGKYTGYYAGHEVRRHRDIRFQKKMKVSSYKARETMHRRLLRKAKLMSIHYT